MDHKLNSQLHSHARNFDLARTYSDHTSDYL